MLERLRRVGAERYSERLPDRQREPAAEHEQSLLAGIGEALAGERDVAEVAGSSAASRAEQSELPAEPAGPPPSFGECRAEVLRLAAALHDGATELESTIGRLGNYKLLLDEVEPSELVLFVSAKDPQAVVGMSAEHARTIKSVEIGRQMDVVASLSAELSAAASAVVGAFGRRELPMEEPEPRPALPDSVGDERDAI